MLLLAVFSFLLPDTCCDVLHSSASLSLSYSIMLYHKLISLFYTILYVVVMKKKTNK